MDIVIERKTLTALHGPFNSERIFHQMTAMMKEHFKTPVLLIELDGRQIPS